jgi:DNA-binding NarL/FixJ family response regulator
MMSSIYDSEPIRIGLVADEPIRLAGLASIFDQPARQAHAQLLPVTGSIREFLSGETPEYLVVDLHSPASGLKALDTVRRERPDIRLMAIGPEQDDELVLNSIMAGARAFLDLNAGPATVLDAIEAIDKGCIWAPRRALSKLIDRLLKVSDSSLTAAVPQLTARERQVLELIMMARSNREIASQLGIEERTVRAHLGRLMRKAGVDNRIKLSMSALSLLPLPHEIAGKMGAAERARRRVTTSSSRVVTKRHHP